MNYLSVSEMSKKWNMSERTVRNYCAQNRIQGAFLTGKTWNIPAGSTKPMREKEIEVTENELLNPLRKEKQAKLKGGIYHKTQINLTFHYKLIKIFFVAILPSCSAHINGLPQRLFVQFHRPLYQ